MNFYYSTSREVIEDLAKANSLNDEEFFKQFNWDPEDRKELVKMLEEDHDKLEHEEREVMFIDDRSEVHGQLLNFV